MGELITFWRYQAPTERLDGAIIAESDQLILLHHLEDFAFDGYTVIRPADVGRRTPSAYNDYTQQLMIQEGTWCDPPDWVRELPVTNWETLLRALQPRFVSLEMEPSARFLIGPIREVDAESLLIHHFDAKGEWLNLELVPLEQLSLLNFGNRYITIHAKYIKPLE